MTSPRSERGQHHPQQRWDVSYGYQHGHQQQPQAYNGNHGYQQAYNSNYGYEQKHQAYDDWYGYGQQRYLPYSHYHPYNNSMYAAGPSHHSYGQQSYHLGVQRDQTQHENRSASSFSYTRTKPRASYMSQANSKLEPRLDKPPKKLLILDLNGTLVYRKKSKVNMSISSAQPTPRPYLDCFLQYCLGISADIKLNQVTPNKKDGTHGSHFWQGKEPPQSQGCYELMVWSSARPQNVNSMLEAAFTEAQRAHLLRVWARDTLVPERLFNHKAESIKDLEIVWTELNALAHGLPSPGRLMAEARDAADRERPDTEGKTSAALEAALKAAELGPWGQQNTVLLDDSADKARLQPFNQILIPVFDREEAARMDLWMQVPLSLPDTKKKEPETKEKSLDDTLLQTIGVLEELRTQRDVSSFMQSKGLGNYGAEHAKKLKVAQKNRKKRGTPEFWAEQGREACKSLGIQVAPWKPRG